MCLIFGTQRLIDLSFQDFDLNKLLKILELKSILNLIRSMA